MVRVLDFKVCHPGFKSHLVLFFYLKIALCVVLIALLIECSTGDLKVWGLNPAKYMFYNFQNHFIINFGQ